MFSISYSKQALRYLRKMPADQAKLVRQKIELYAQDPSALTENVSKLQERDGYKLRVGRWRVLFDHQGNVLEILKIRPRGDVYR
uniref:Plasmid stabilization system n=1 Tax=Magnetococcus massalia (strain MO-1) TaxID=451514 RepID=A0A1S7LI61_MAGMO|nr:Conserved protein of unknown function [Candidatus Magnetococcus massalia]